MHTLRDIEFSDMQALVRFGHGHLKDSRFLLLHIKDRTKAGAWLSQEPFSSAQPIQTLPETAMQIAFTYTGLSTLGLPNDVLNQFSEEFIVGMSGDESRTRRLGDVGQSAPDNWHWGHSDRYDIHVLLLLYARTGALENYQQRIVTDIFNSAFQVLHTLPTSTLSAKEPFGFNDGISQPAIDWKQIQQTDVHARDAYSNLLAPGEIVLGYTNEYGQLTRRPLIDTDISPSNTTLPFARDNLSQRDFGGNGSYLIVRQLQQDVPVFQNFVHENTVENVDKADDFAAAMVGRRQNGESLIPASNRSISGIAKSQINNHFDFDNDPDGVQCPIGSHIRRSNPRTGDFAPGVTGLFSRLQRILGFKRRSEYEDLIASSRYHRILRRGRTYSGTTHKSEHGLQFICLAGNILRQFEFIQSAWCVSSMFAGTREQRDPLLGHRQPRTNDTRTDAFMQANTQGAQYKTASLPEFVSVRGGGYFFMPGIQAIKYLGELAQQEPIE